MVNRNFSQKDYDKEPRRRRKFLEMINELLKEGKELTYSDIGKEFERRYPDLISKSDRNIEAKYKSYYEAMHKAISDIDRIMKVQGYSLKREGSNKTGYRYSYPEGFVGIDEWFKEKAIEKQRMRLTELLKLIVKSKGLLPDSWMVDLTARKLRDLEGLEDKKIIEFDYNENLSNIDLIPLFYNAIDKKKVLKMTNKAAYQFNRKIQLIPYFLKEFNNRWFCIGMCIKADGSIQEDYICALDRVSNVEESTDFLYQEAKRDYSHYFDDIIGIRHEMDLKTGLLMKKEHILIQTRSQYTHGRILTKPLHSSQMEIAKFGEGPNGMGIVSIDVVPNLELITLILGFGSKIKVIGPESVVGRIADIAKKMAALYEEA